MITGANISEVGGTEIVSSSNISIAALPWVVKATTLAPLAFISAMWFKSIASFVGEKLSNLVPTKWSYKKKFYLTMVVFILASWILTASIFFPVVGMIVFVLIRWKNVWVKRLPSAA